MPKPFYYLLLFSCIAIALTLPNSVEAQGTQDPYLLIIQKFKQWKALQYKAGKYATEKACNPDSVLKEDYAGAEMGIPQDISVDYCDLNIDNRLDALITFNPQQCDGGNALMNAQSRVLILSKGTGYVVDDSMVDKIEEKLKKGWLIIESASYGSLYGTYYEYRESDGRCCPSIKRPFTIDYKTRKLTYN